MHHHRRAGVFVQLAEATDVVYVRVRTDDRLYFELVPPKQIQNAANFVARIHDQRLSRNRVSDDRAVTLQHPDGNGNMQESLLLHAYCWSHVVHNRSITCTSRSQKRSEQAPNVGATSKAAASPPPALAYEAHDAVCYTVVGGRRR